MKWWPWRRAEARDYTSDRVESSFGSATGTSRGAIQTAAAEVAAGIVGRAFAAAEVSGERAELVTPECLHILGRELILRGEAAFRIAGPPLRLEPLGSWSVYGPPDPMTWIYETTAYGADSSESRRELAPSVIHVRNGTDPVRPSRGLSPFRLAKMTSETLSKAEDSAAGEAAIKPTRIANLPGNARQNKDIFAELAKGGFVAVGSAVTGPYIDGQEPSSRWRPQEMHPDPTQGHVELRRQAMLDMLAAAGVPPVLADSRADGGSRREAYRQLVSATIAPLGRLAAREFSDKLDTEITFDFRRLAAGDTQGRARAIKALTDSGLELNAALSIVGLLEESGV